VLPIDSGFHAHGRRMIVYLQEIGLQK
jgi:hypothetical protein